MGTTGLKEKREYVTFQSIQDSLSLTDPIILKLYLSEIFNDLVDLKDEQNKKMISKITFYDYIKLPIFIANKLFKSFTKSKQYGLNEEEFVDNLFKLYTGTFEEIVKLIFDILDFNKDGHLNKDDIKIFLSYIPLEGINEEYDLEGNSNKYNSNENDLSFKAFQRQMKSLEEIDKIVNKAFKKMNNTMNFEQFIQLINGNKSEILLLILCFLYNQIPFNTDNIKALKIKYEKQNKDDNLKVLELDYKRRNKKSDSILIKLPKYNSILSSAEIFLKKNNIRKFSLIINRRKSFDNIHCFGKNKDSSIKKTDNINNNNGDINVDNKQIKILVNELLKDKQISLISLKSINCDNNKNKIIGYNDTNNFIATYENWIYKMTKNGNMKRIYLVLINKDIYYYKSNTKKDYEGMHNLTGCFVEKINYKINSEGKEYFAFEIYMKNKSRKSIFLTNFKYICDDFLKNIKKAIGYKIFSDYYELQKVIGEGAYGIVYLGINKKTGEKVAIKTIDKVKISNLKSKEYIMNEIDILKKCYHPNIVRLLDHFEDKDYIYIVLEYIEGGTLRDYFEKELYDFTEEQAANIMSQIAKGIKYLHKYGIIHRDLKPNNIMITQLNNYGTIKIADFGLSKILSPTERIISLSGTHLYMAPEIFEEIPFNKEVDIWSIGVIFYLMLNGKLPFKGENTDEIARKVINDDLKFDGNFWEKRTKKVKDLIGCCLNKDWKKRINIDDFLNHSWFKKHLIKK